MKYPSFAIAGAFATVAMLGAALPAQAAHVNIGVNIGIPVAPVYVQPEPVYVEPAVAPVYVAPVAPPVRVVTPPVIMVREPGYYYGRDHRWREHERYEHERYEREHGYRDHWDRDEHHEHHRD